MSEALEALREVYELALLMEDGGATELAEWSTKWDRATATIRSALEQPSTAEALAAEQRMGKALLTVCDLETVNAVTAEYVSLGGTDVVAPSTAEIIDLRQLCVDELDAWNKAPQEKGADKVERFALRDMSETDVPGGLEVWWKNGRIVRLTAAARDDFNRTDIESVRVTGKPSTAEAQARALDLILEYIGVDGDHHKQWLLDQVVRVLAGDKYEAVVAEWQAGEDGPETYSWDEGVAP